MMPDAFTALCTIVTATGEVTIRQRIGGALFVRWPDGQEEDYPAGFSVGAVEADVRQRLEIGKTAPP